MYCKYCGTQTQGNADVCQSCSEALNRKDDGIQNGDFGNYGNTSEKGFSDRYESKKSTYGYYEQPKNDFYRSQPANDFVKEEAPLSSKGEVMTAKYGMKKGVTSTILSIVSFIFYFIMLGLLGGRQSSGVVVCFLIGGTLVVISLVMGIRGIIMAAEALKKKVKAVAPLVFGIVGTSIAGFMVLYYLIGFVALSAIL